MTGLPRVVQLDEFGSSELLEREVRVAGTYTQVGEIRGNSILSSVFVQSIDPGATIQVNYYDTTTGAAVGERYDLQAHDPIDDTATGQTFRILVTKIHHRVVMEAIVIGGSAEFSVYATVVSSTASDIDTALVREASDFNALTSRGMPAVTYDEASGKLHFLRSTAGVLDVNVEGGSGGTTDTFNGTVGTTPALVPAVAGNGIIDVLVRAASDQTKTKRLSVSFDGVGFHVLSPGEFVGWTLKGQPTQITIVGNVAGVVYEVTMNRVS